MNREKKLGQPSTSGSWPDLKLNYIELDTKWRTFVGKREILYHRLWKLEKHKQAKLSLEKSVHIFWLVYIWLWTYPTWVAEGSRSMYKLYIKKLKKKKQTFSNRYMLICIVPCWKLIRCCPTQSISNVYEKIPLTSCTNLQDIIPLGSVHHLLVSSGAVVTSTSGHCTCPSKQQQSSP